VDEADDSLFAVLVNPEDVSLAEKIHQGSHVEGFVNHNFLTPAAKFNQPPPQSGIREVHLKTTKKIARNVG